VLNPALRKGQWTRAEVVTAMTLLRDLDGSRKNAKIVATLKRGATDVSNMMSQYITPALLNSNGELVLSHDDDKFKASVDVVWVAVQKANGLKNNKNRVEATALVTDAPLSEIVQDSNIANKATIKRKRKRAEWKSKNEEMTAKVRNAVITADQEKELADPNSKEKWVQDCQAAEKRLLDSGVTTEQLNSLIDFYKSRLNEGLKPGGAPLFSKSNVEQGKATSKSNKAP
jgi:hypothetical protein